MSAWRDKPEGSGWHWYLAPGEAHPVLHAIALAHGENGEAIYLACEPFAPRERMGARDIRSWPPGKWAVTMAPPQLPEEAAKSLEQAVRARAAESSLSELVEEGLAYFAMAGDEGDRLYAEAIRQRLAELEPALSKSVAKRLAAQGAPEAIVSVFPHGEGWTVGMHVGVQGFRAEYEGEDWDAGEWYAEQLMGALRAAGARVGPLHTASGYGAWLAGQAFPIPP